MHAGSYIISNLFVAVCIISFHFFGSDSASPTAQLEWGLRIILWRSVLELLKVNTRSCLIVIYYTTILYKSVTDDRVFFSISRYLDYMFIVFTNALHAVNNLRLKTTSSENGAFGA